MQTFLPYNDFEATAKVLDYRRLGKQRLETWQIIGALHRTSGGWVNHPAVRMWRGYEESLSAYGLTICREWVARGYRDTMTERFVDLLRGVKTIVYPAWMGDEELHISHQSNLIRKDREHYGDFWPDVPDDLPYYWPVTD